MAALITGTSQHSMGLGLGEVCFAILLLRLRRILEMACHSRHRALSNALLVHTSNRGVFFGDANQRGACSPPKREPERPKHS